MVYCIYRIFFSLDRHNSKEKASEKKMSNVPNFDFGAAASASGRHHNFTRSLITINTNTTLKGKSDDHQEIMKRNFITSVQNVMQNQTSISKIFGDPVLVKRIDVETFDVEEGPTNGFLHGTLVVKVQHDVDRYRIGQWQRPMQEELKKQPEWGMFNGAFVSASLASARTLNYSGKEARKARKAQRKVEMARLKKSNPALYAKIRTERLRLEAKGAPPIQRRDTSGHTQYIESETSARKAGSSA